MLAGDGVEPLLTKHCNVGCMLLLMGPAAAGKTSLALHLARHMGGKVLYINTEGSPNDERALQVFQDDLERIVIVDSYSQEHLVEILIEAWWGPRASGFDVVVVDSVNNLYRPHAGEGELPLDMFMFINALLFQIAREGGRVISTAQVSMNEHRPSGAPVLERYSTLKLVLEKGPGLWRRAWSPELGVDCIFQVTARGIEWRECWRRF